MNPAQGLLDLIPSGYNAIQDYEAIRTPFGDAFFRAITELGTEQFWIVLIAVIFWSFSKDLGRKLALIYLSSSYINLVLKYSFGIPRPDDPRTNKIIAEHGLFKAISLAHESTPSFPSNHAQSVLVGWAYLAQAVNKWWFWLLAFLVVFLTGLSRIYLGAHYPVDVIGGWIIGYIFIRTWLALEKNVKNRLSGIPLSWQSAAVIVVTLILIIIWPQENASKILGAFAGLSLGFMLEQRKIRFAVDGPAWKRILRGVVGLIIVFGVLEGGRLFTGIIRMGSYIRLSGIPLWMTYMATGFTASALVPVLLMALKLADRERK